MQEPNTKLIWRIIHKIKVLFFIIASSITQNNSCNDSIYLIIQVLEFLQIIYFPLIIIFKSSIGSNEVNLLKTFNTINFWKSIDSLTSVTLIALMSTLILLACLSYITMGLLHNIHKEKPTSNILQKYEIRKNFAIKIQSFLAVFIHNYGEMPIYLLIIRSLSCIGKCGDIMHSIRITIGILLSIYMLVISKIVTSIAIDKYPLSTMPWSSLSSKTILFIKPFYKISFCCFYVLDKNSTLYALNLISAFILQCIVLWLLLVNPEGYHSLPSKAEQLMHGMLPYYTIGLFFIKLSKVNPTSVVFSFHLITSVLFGVFFCYIKDFYEQRFITLSIPKIKSESAAVHLFNFIIKRIKSIKDNPFNLMIVYGLIDQHKSSCADASCFCNSVEMKLIDSKNYLRSNSNISNINASNINASSTMSLEKKKSSSNENSDNLKSLTIYMTQTVSGYYAKYVEFMVTKFPKSQDLRILLSCIHRMFTGNYYKCLYEAKYLEEKLHTTTVNEFFLREYYASMETEFSAFVQENKGEINDDYEQFQKEIEFEICYENMKKQAAETAELVIKFWGMLEDKKENAINDLFDIGEKISNNISKIQIEYTRGCEIFPNNYKLSSHYANFQKYIISNEVEEQSIRQKLRVNDISSVSAGDTYKASFIVVISANPTSFAKIVKCTSEIKMLGYDSNNMIGRSINELMPQYFSDVHNGFIEKFINNKEKGKLKLKPIKTKAGFLTQIYSRIAVLDTVQSGLLFVNRCDICNPEEFFSTDEVFDIERYIYIMCNADNKIIGVNENCYNILGIPCINNHSGVSEAEGITLSSIIPRLPSMSSDRRYNGEIEIDTTKLIEQFSEDQMSAKDKSIYQKIKKNAGKFIAFIKMSEESYGVEEIKFITIKGLVLKKATGEAIHAFINTSPHLRKQSIDRVNQNMMSFEDSPTNKVVVKQNVEAIKSGVMTHSPSKQVFQLHSIYVWFLIIHIVAASILFTLQIINRTNFTKSIELLCSTLYWHSNAMHSYEEANALIMAANATVFPERVTLDEVDLFDYSNEQLQYDIAQKQNITESLLFIYDAIIDLFSEISGRIIEINELLLMGNQITRYLHINESDIRMSIAFSRIVNIDYESMRALLSIRSFTNFNSLKKDVYLILNNPIDSTVAYLENLVSYIHATVSQRASKHLQSYFIICGLVCLANIVLAGLLIPKLIVIQKQKLKIILLYYSMTKEEITKEYAKAHKFLQYDNTEIESVGGNQSQTHKNDFTNGQSKELKDGENTPRSLKEEEDAEEDVQKLSMQMKTSGVVNKTSIIFRILGVATIFANYFIAIAIVEQAKKSSLLGAFSVIEHMSNLNTNISYAIELITMHYYYGIGDFPEDKMSQALSDILAGSKYRNDLSQLGYGYLDNLIALNSVYDSSSFCNLTISNITQVYANYSTILKINSSTCNSSYKGSMSRGMTQGIFSIYQELDKMNSERTQLLPCNASILYNISNMYTFYIYPASISLLTFLKQEVIDYFKSKLAFIVAYFTIYILTLVLIYAIMWRRYLKNLELELYKSKGMLSIAPLYLINRFIESENIDLIEV